MFCIYCFHTKTRVANTRPHKKHPQTWRRRQCLQCHKTFTSYERPASEELVVALLPQQKTSQPPSATEPFNLGKLILSIARAAQHDQRQASYDSYELASTIELELILAASAAQKKEPLTNGDSPLMISISKIVETTHETLKRYDALTALQYAAQHQLITSARRRGRPSTIATNDADPAARG